MAPGATATTNEYIWLDDQAVGYVAINSSGVSTLQYVTTGQIDEPLLVTKASQTVSWNGYTDPFGLGATFPGATTVFNLRLPGQWWQPETSQLGLSLNGARNYDPTLGRYTQADPLGIDAGANPYAYVDGDPLNETDPWGQDSSTLVCVYYDFRASETKGALQQYYKNAKQICQNQRIDVNVLVSTAIIMARINKHLPCNKDIIEHIRLELISYDVFYRNLNGPNGVTGSDINNYHNQTFGDNGLPPWGYGGNDFPPGVGIPGLEPVNPVPNTHH